MSLSPAEMVALLTEAIATTRRSRAIVMELRTRAPLPETAPKVRGRYLGHDGVSPVYGYTRRQCEALLAAIYEAARQDAGDG